MKVSILLRKKVTRLKSYVFNNLKSLLITRCRSIAEIIPEQYRFFWSRGNHFDSGAYVSTI